jgi:Icc-related predicted phosphoesterase
LRFPELPMPKCFFASDLHGIISRYQTLFLRITEEMPDALFLGGDLFPSFGNSVEGGFISNFLVPELEKLRVSLKDRYPRVFLILGNDDGLESEAEVISVMEDSRLWEYVQDRPAYFDSYTIYGYAYVPPTPFMNKDWERYDISRYVDPGCIPPEEGWSSRNEPLNHIQNATIKEDLDKLSGQLDFSKTILLFHAPPYQTNLDRAALDGKMIDHVPLDLHVGSLAVKDFIISQQPLITLHGHVHESARITGSWQDRLGSTFAFSAAHDGPELALVRFDPTRPGEATRDLY